MEAKEIMITNITPNKDYICLDCYFNHVQSLLKEKGATEPIIDKITKKIEQKTSAILSQQECLLCYKKNFALPVIALSESFTILNQLKFSID